MDILQIRAKKTSLKQQIWVNLANFCSYQFQKHENYEKLVELFEIYMLKYLPANHGQEKNRTWRFLISLTGLVSKKIQKISDHLKDIRKFFKSRPSRKL